MSTRESRRRARLENLPSDAPAELMEAVAESYSIAISTPAQMLALLLSDVGAHIEFGAMLWNDTAPDALTDRLEQIADAALGAIEQAPDLIARLDARFGDSPFGNLIATAILMVEKLKPSLVRTERGVDGVMALAGIERQDARLLTMGFEKLRDELCTQLAELSDHLRAVDAMPNTESSTAKQLGKPMTLEARDESALPSTDDPDSISKAIGIFSTNPQLSDRAVARRAGIKHPSKLTRSPEYQRIKQAFAGDGPPRGVKDGTTGDIDATDE